MQKSDTDNANPAEQSTQSEQRDHDNDNNKRPHEIGGPKGPEPTRYGDWEKKGRCIDF